MNEELKEQKIKRFLADEVMSFFVRDALRDTFLKPAKETDVQYLAASRIALDLLDQGFKDLQQYRSPNREDAKITTNHGV